MTDTTRKVARGLEDVVAVETSIGRVDGARGQLVIGGHRVEELARDHSFEELFALLWDGAPPDADTLDALRAELAARRADAFERLASTPAVALDDPMDALRASLAGLETTGDLRAAALAALGTVPVANALWWAARRGAAPVPPSSDRGQAADYLHMVTGDEPPEAAWRALERYLVTVSDHGMNASTFTARVIASTRAGLVGALVGAVGALEGPLHGGAPGPVLDMLDAIGSPENAEDWIRAELDAGRRIMGMGHRVYRVRDPRAAVFEEALTTLEDSRATSGRLELARAVEQTAEAVLAERYPERSLRANVEFYTAVLLEALGLPRELFTPTFAVGRAIGWAAHVREQREEGRLIRPRSRYVGPEPSS